MNTFETFNNGKLVTPAATKDFSDIPWREHPDFTGVELKHILTSEETNGAYSYHLVRIAPNCSIGEHMYCPLFYPLLFISASPTMKPLFSTSIPIEPSVCPDRAIILALTP